VQVTLPLLVELPPGPVTFRVSVWVPVEVKVLVTLGPEPETDPDHA
jgi:hypothetical protein